MEDWKHKIRSGQPTLLILWKVGGASDLFKTYTLFAKIKYKTAFPLLSLVLYPQRVVCPLRAAPMMMFSSGRLVMISWIFWRIVRTSCAAWALIVDGSMPYADVSIFQSVAFGAVYAVEIRISAASAIVSITTAATKRRDELALF
ncbi:hypothetical protein HNY73_011512 [Argiope bruennichi]|uniref:Uncharacterized protein n=1 Tax=Argiope bruennichi TaxID=94029 RepID=A0A8T0F4A7_ARGBR|nr:hypothetical protein HNY73_011512 [Argiope bruennichi]